MGNELTVLTWNLNGDAGVSTDRIERQKQFFRDHHHETDLFCLQAVDWTRSDHFDELIEFFEEEWCYDVTHTRDWNRQLLGLDVQPYHNINGRFKHCLLTASRWPIERNPLDLKNSGSGKPVGLNYFYTNFPDGLLVSDVRLPNHGTVDSGRLELWNVGIVHGSGWKEEKINALETVYARVFLQNKKTDKRVILGGDFNAPLKETLDGDGEPTIVPHDGNRLKAKNRPFYGNPYRYRISNEDSEPFTFSQRWKNAESYIFDPELADWDMRDTYWSAEDGAKKSSMDDHTHVVHNGNPANKRLDHLLADDQFDVKTCEIQNGIETDVNGFDVSDHAPVVSEFET